MVKEEIPYSIDEIYNLINKVANVNVIIQIQSYGRIFVYDQQGTIGQDDAICIYSEDDETKEQQILRAYWSYYLVLCSTARQEQIDKQELIDGIFEDPKKASVKSKCEKLLKDLISQTEPDLSEEMVKLKIDTWFRGPNTHFMGETPNMKIQEGQGRKVKMLLEQLSA